MESRSSTDGKINRGEKKLIRIREEMGLSIVNGNIKGDERNKFTYEGAREKSVIDYVIIGRGRIESTEIGNKVDLDHFPLIIKIRGRERVKKNRRGSENRRSRKGCWKWERIQRFRNRIGVLRRGERITKDKVERDMKRIRGVLEEEKN